MVSSARAADKPPELRFGSRPLRADVDLVLVPATVIDSLNRPVTSLQKHDFEVYDGNEAQEIKYFSQEDAPISIGILLDTSGSMKNKYDLAREAVTQLFANANRDDDYFVITFSERPALLADTTQSVETIEAELANVEPSGGTPLLDAIYLGLNKLKHARYQRRALVIISDGGDNKSRYRSKEIRAMAQESDAQIYALGIFSPVTIAVEDWAGKKLLAHITGATGGRVVFLSSAERLPEVSAAFSRELRSQYVLGYQPKGLQHDGRLHKIKIKLASTLARPVQLYYKREYLASR
ncbi:MAG: VWA domain-containing protein [Terriglobales bacterium]